MGRFVLGGSMGSQSDRGGAPVLLKRAVTRAARIEKFVAMSARGKWFIPI